MLKDDVIKLINENKLINNKILLAVSGGADSIALLHVFYELQKELNVKLHVAHFNHCFRGEEASQDAIFVKNTCEKLFIPCTIGKKNIPKLLSKNKSQSAQNVSRKLRYEFLVSTALKNHCDIIAAAHNLNDQAETFFLHLLRGTGLKGLIGMDFCTKLHNEIKLIRPFLNISRLKIENYLKENNLKFRQDSSNLSDHYLRNHIRHHLIPFIKENYNPNIDVSISKLSKLLFFDNDFLEKYVSNEIEKIVKEQDNEFIVNIDSLRNLHPSISKRVFREIILMLQGNLNTITFDHIEAIEELIKKQSGRQIDLPGNIIVRHDFKNLVFSNKQKKFTDFEINILVPSITKIPTFGITINVSIKKEMSKTKNNNTAYFSFSELPQTLLLRNRRIGDHFIPEGLLHTKKIKKFFIDLKIPKDKKEKIPLLLYNEEIIWVIGYRKTEKYKPKKNDKKIIEIKVEENNDNM